MIYIRDFAGRALVRIVLMRSRRSYPRRKNCIKACSLENPLTNLDESFDVTFISSTKAGRNFLRVLIETTELDLVIEIYASIPSMQIRQFDSLIISYIKVKAV